MSRHRSDSARRPAPPLGWNSWDCFGGSVTEQDVLHNAEFMSHHLLEAGWNTVVVDIQWAEPDPGTASYRPVSDPELDAYGRPLPAVGRFPSAAGGAGFAPLAARIHDLGLAFGVHVMRGIPRKAVEQDLPVLGGRATASQIVDWGNLCPWNPDNAGIDHTVPGAADYYDSVARLFAEWGVDFVKLDDVLYPPIQRADIEGWAGAIRRSGRDMQLSLSPGRRLSTEHLDLLRATSTMWRISDDLWDVWSDIEEQFQRAARWAPLQIPGSWADADMLPLGRLAIRGHVGPDRQSRLTFAEQQTMLTLWVMMRSPLMFGGHLPDSPPETIALLTNGEVLDLLREGRGNRETVRDGDHVVWAAHTDRAEYRAVFNLADATDEVSVPLGDLGLPEAVLQIRDVWDGTPVTTAGSTITLRIAAHGVRLIRFSATE